MHGQILDEKEKKFIRRNSSFWGQSYSWLLLSSVFILVFCSKILDESSLDAKIDVFILGFSVIFVIFMNTYERKMFLKIINKLASPKELI